MKMSTNIGILFVDSKVMRSLLQAHVVASIKDIKKVGGHTWDKGPPTQRTKSLLPYLLLCLLNVHALPSGHACVHKSPQLCRASKHCSLSPCVLAPQACVRCVHTHSLAMHTCTLKGVLRVHAIAATVARLHGKR